jgi:hypothetical protein
LVEIGDGPWSAFQLELLFEAASAHSRWESQAQHALLPSGQIRMADLDHRRTNVVRLSGCGTTVDAAAGIIGCTIARWEGQRRK